MSAVIPVLIAGVLLYGLYKRVPVLDVFVEGAAEALPMMARLLPLLLAMTVAIGIMRSSGIFEAAAAWLAPLCARIGMPAGVVPLFLVRPISGSGATAMLAEAYQAYGPDSYTGRVASVLMGSSETIIYTLTVYLGAVGIKSGRHALLVALLAQCAALAAALVICSWI